VRLASTPNVDLYIALSPDKEKSKFDTFLRAKVSDNQAFYHNFQQDLTVLQDILEHEPDYVTDFQFLVDPQGHTHLFDFDTCPEISCLNHTPWPMKNRTDFFDTLLKSAAREHFANNASLT
jgi:hypothetical protein